MKRQVSTQLMKKLTTILVLLFAYLTIAGCSTIKGYISPSSSSSKKNNPTKQYCTVIQKMNKSSKGASQVGPGTTIADAVKALKRIDDAYSDLEKFSTNNPDFKVDEAKNAYETFKQSAPTLSGEGSVGDAATQLRTTLEAFTTTMNGLVATACPTK